MIVFNIYTYLGHVLSVFFLFAGYLPPAYKRSLFVLSAAMLMSAAKIYQMADLINLLKSLFELDVSINSAILNH